MSTSELQQILAEEISLIDDVDFLTALKTIVESKLSSDSYQLTNDQLKRIEQSHQEWLNNRLIPSEELHSELKQWLDTE